MVNDPWNKGDFHNAFQWGVMAHWSNNMCFQNQHAPKRHLLKCSVTHLVVNCILYIGLFCTSVLNVKKNSLPCCLQPSKYNYDHIYFCWNKAPFIYSSWIKKLKHFIWGMYEKIVLWCTIKIHLWLWNSSHFWPHLRLQYFLFKRAEHLFYTNSMKNENKV